MLEKKYEAYTYSELLQEYEDLVEKTEVLKKEIIIEMAKRKEAEGIDKKKVASVLYEDLKKHISASHIRNILSNSGYTATKHTPNKNIEELRAKGIEEEKILVAAGMGEQSLEPEPEKQVLPTPKSQNNEEINLLDNEQEIEIIDQSPHQEEEHEPNDLEKIELIRNLKVENNNLEQRLTQVDQLLEENKQLRETITELEKENTRLFNKNKELEEENNKLKQENRALRNPPKVESTITDKFSKKDHGDYIKNKYYNMKTKK